MAARPIMMPSTPYRSLYSQGFFGRVDIAIAKDGDVDTGILFYPGDQGPVGLAFIKLGAGAAVDGQGLDAHVLQAFGHFFDIFRLVVPAQSGLYGHRQAGAFDHRRRQAGHQRHVFQYGGAGAFADHFFHGAAKIDVHQVGLDGIDDPGAHGHCFFVAAEDLDAERAFVFKEIQLLPAFDGIADQSFAGDEFAVHQIGAVLFADIPERGVAHVFHGGQEERKIRKLYLADVYHAKVANLRTIGRFP